VYIGRDLFGGSFCHDPWELYRRGLVTGPNMIVLGQIGRGKSSFIKTYLWRSQVFGRQAWVVDPKGEYGPVAEASGTRPLRIGPGLGVRLNPLDPGSSVRGAAGGDAGQVASAAGTTAGRAGGNERGRRQGELLCSLAAASLGRALTPEERTSAELALAAVAGRSREPTLPAVVDALLRPLPASAALVHTDAAHLAADGRQVALELRRLVEGDLAGMFDGPTTTTLDLGGPMVVLDLSAVYASPALGILMTCATAWLQSVLQRDDGVRRLVVVDEAWAILHDLAMGRWLRAGFKLARAHGVAYAAVVHRLSDLKAAGADGSEQQRLAEGLLSDSETRVIYGQPPSEVSAAVELLGLTSTEAELLPHLPRGVALWKVGSRSFLVEHRLGRLERVLVDTDARMVPAP
jgi:hypothetical protein